MASEAPALTQTGKRLVAFAAYTPAHSDELPLAVGDRVVTLQSYDDGWTLVQNEQSRVGLVPNNFLKDMEAVPKPASASPAGPTGMKTVPSRVTSLVVSGNLFSLANAKLDGKGKAAGEDHSAAGNLNSSLPGTSELVSSPGKASVQSKPQSRRPSAGKAPAWPSLEQVKKRLAEVAAARKSRSRVPETIGRLRILVAGDSGIGKTSLIHRFLSVPEIHLTSPIIELSMSPEPTPLETQEYHATTEADAHHLPTRRRRSSSSSDSDLKPAASPSGNYGDLDELLDTLTPDVDAAPRLPKNGPSKPAAAGAASSPVSRKHTLTNIPPADTKAANQFNITFIDSPGYSHALDALSVIRPIVLHQLHRFLMTDALFAREAPPQPIVRFLSANTGAHTHIDAAVYCIFHRLTKVDVEYIKRLDRVTAVIPVFLVRSRDDLSPAAVAKLKKSVVDTLRESGVDLYTFGLSMEEWAVAAEAAIAGGRACLPPFIVSAKAPHERDDGDDGPAIDEFNNLRDAIFFTHADDLRACTADRFVRWRQAGSSAKI